MTAQTICNDELTITFDGDTVIVEGTGEPHTRPPDHDEGAEVVNRITGTYIDALDSITSDFGYEMTISANEIIIHNEDLWAVTGPALKEGEIKIGGNDWSH